MQNDSDTQGDLATIKLSLPSSLLAQVDEATNRNYADRDEFIRDAIRRYLEHLQATASPKPEVTAR